MFHNVDPKYCAKVDIDDLHSEQLEKSNIISEFTRNLYIKKNVQYAESSW